MYEPSYAPGTNTAMTGGTHSRLGTGSTTAVIADHPRTMTGMRGEYDSAYDDEYSSSRDGKRFTSNDVYGVPSNIMTQSYPGASASATAAQQQFQQQRDYIKSASSSIYNNPTHLHHHQPLHHSSHQPHVVHGPRRLFGDGYNDPVYINRSARASDHKMLINVGGVRHEILWVTLEKFPNTRLGRLQECRTEDAILNFCDFYSYEDNEYFFDKNPRIFNAVLSCYRIGKLHLPDEFCLTELVTELRYWGFDENYLDLCCQQKYKGRKALYQEMRSDAEAELIQYHNNQLGMLGMSGIPGYDNMTNMMMYDDRFGIGQCAAYRKFLWDSYENPRYSKTTKVLPMISIVFSVLAVIGVALNSVDSIKERNKAGQVMDNVLISRTIMVCVAWVSIEYVLRLFSSPNVTRFLFDGCNIIDLLGCGLYFYTLLQQTTKPPVDRINDLWKLYLMFRSWRIPNLICKLLYEPQTLKLDSETLSNFNKQFGILLLFFSTATIMFATAIFMAEKDHPGTPFISIPDTFWYTIATLTTAGNSVNQPSTTWGKYFGALCSVVGVLFLASVITIANFARVLQNISYTRNPNVPPGAQNPNMMMNILGINSGNQMGMAGTAAASSNTYQSMMMNPMNAASILKNKIPMLNTQSSTSQSNLLQYQQQLQQQQLLQQQQMTMAGGLNQRLGGGGLGTQQQIPTTSNVLRELNEANCSFHHVTFTDDLATALGTIDILVERDRATKSLSREQQQQQHTNNKVKGITLKIKFDPLPRLSSTIGRDINATSIHSTTHSSRIGPDGIKHGPNKLLGGQLSNQSTTGVGVGSTTVPTSVTQVTSANERGGALPALV